MRPLTAEPVCFDVECGERVPPPAWLEAPVLRQFQCEPACVSSDGRVVSASRDDGVVPGAAPGAVRVDHGIDDAAVSPDGRWIAGVDENDVTLFDGGGARVLARWSAPESGPFRCSTPASVAWSPRGDWLAVGTREGRLLLFEILQGWARTRDRGRRGEAVR